MSNNKKLQLFRIEKHITIHLDGKKETEYFIRRLHYIGVYQPFAAVTQSEYWAYQISAALNGLEMGTTANKRVKQGAKHPAQQLNQAIALLNRWMEHPEQNLLLSDTYRFVRDATACT